VLPAEAVEAVVAFVAVVADEACNTPGASLPTGGRGRGRHELCQGQELLAVELEQQVVVPVRLTRAFAPAPASSGRSHHGGAGMMTVRQSASLRCPNSPWSAAHERRAVVVAATHASTARMHREGGGEGVLHCGQRCRRPACVLQPARIWFAP